MSEIKELRAENHQMKESEASYLDSIAKLQKKIQ